MWDTLRLVRHLFARRSETRQLIRSATAAPDNPAALFEQGLACVRAHRTDEAIGYFRSALARQSNLSVASFNLALLLKQEGKTDEAIAVLIAALHADPANSETLSRLRHVLNNGQVPAWHFSMLNDRQRNEAYAQAIRTVVHSEDCVFEIGTGAGLLAMLAARQGARKVVTCEMVAPLAAKARQIVDRNGYAGQIDIVALKSTDIRIPEHLAEPADVLVAEIVSGDLLGEGLLDSYDDARARLLKPDARIVPMAATVFGQLAGSPEVEHFLRVEEIDGFDMREFNDFTPMQLPVDDLVVPLHAFSEPFTAFDFDFCGSARIPPQGRILTVPVTRDGICHGVHQWLRLQLCEGVHYENAPEEASATSCPGHWRRVLHPFRRPLALKKGQALQLTVAHDRNSLLFHAHVPEDDRNS